MVVTNEIKLGNYTATTSDVRKRRHSAIYWGPPGGGKTTLASTAPKPLLLLNFDSDGSTSISDVKDIIEFDLSQDSGEICARFSEPDPMQLSKLIEKQGIKTVVVDSITSFVDKALQYGVEHAQRSKQHMRSGITLEDPGFGGYGRRKTWALGLFRNMNALTLRHMCHVIYIGHEDSPEKDSDGNFLYQTLALGSDLPDKTGLSVSEVWHVRDTGKERRIAVRPFQGKKPIKSRMFTTKDAADFAWKYDPTTRKGHTVEQWIKEWERNKWLSMPLPK